MLSGVRRPGDFYAMGVAVPRLGNPPVDWLLLEWDRALVGDPYADAPTCSGHYSQEAVGFCLVAPAS